MVLINRFGQNFVQNYVEFNGGGCGINVRQNPVSWRPVQKKSASRDVCPRERLSFRRAYHLTIGTHPIEINRFFRFLYRSQLGWCMLIQAAHMDLSAPGSSQSQKLFKTCQTQYFFNLSPDQLSGCGFRERFCQGIVYCPKSCGIKIRFFSLVYHGFYERSLENRVFPYTFRKSLSIT